MGGAQEAGARAHLCSRVPLHASLVPTLLNNMPYQEYDEELLAIEGADVRVKDRAQDLAPHFHRSRGGGGGDDDDDGGGGGGGGGGGDSDEEEEEDDEDEFEAVNNWSRRRCAVSALDAISCTVDDLILPPLLVQLDAGFSSEEWQTREASILALGAVREVRKVMGYMEQLMPFLVAQANEGGCSV